MDAHQPEFALKLFPLLLQFCVAFELRYRALAAAKFPLTLLDDRIDLPRKVALVPAIPGLGWNCLVSS
jgi:hypothetical protein